MSEPKYEPLDDQSLMLQAVIRVLKKKYGLTEDELKDAMTDAHNDDWYRWRFENGIDEVRQYVQN